MTYTINRVLWVFCLQFSTFGYLVMLFLLLIVGLHEGGTELILSMLFNFPVLYVVPRKLRQFIQFPLKFLFFATLFLVLQASYV